MKAARATASSIHNPKYGDLFIFPVNSFMLLKMRRYILVKISTNIMKIMDYDTLLWIKFESGNIGKVIGKGNDR